MYKINKPELLAEVMVCMERGMELVVFNYAGQTKIQAFREGMVPGFQGWRDVLYSYKFDIADVDPTTEDAEWALDAFLLEALEDNNVEVVAV